MAHSDDDAQRLVALYSELSTPLLNYLARRVTPVEDAADLLSETFVVAFRRIERLPTGDEAARMWMFGVARRVLANHYRSGVRRRALADALRTTIRLSYRDDHDEFSTVREAIEALPGNQRELVRLVHWDGFSVAEAAAVLSVSGSTARGRYERARKNLRRSLRATPATVATPSVRSRVSQPE